MKLVYNGIRIPYVYDTETKAISDPPMKCINCKSKDKVAIGCKLGECKK
jgi:hypothetical protein